MDSIGGMLNPIGKMPKTHYKKEFCNGYTGKNLMVYNGILMETIRISLMVSFGLLLFFLAGCKNENLLILIKKYTIILNF